MSVAVPKFLTVLVLVVSVSVAEISLEQRPVATRLNVPVNISWLNISNDHPIDGEIVTITARVTNNASVVTQGMALVLMQDREEVIRSVPLAVPAHSYVDVSVPWMAKKWGHAIIALLEFDGSPLPNRTISRQVEVRGKPLGDCWSVIFCLLSVGLTVLTVAVAPSLYSVAMRGRQA